MANNNLDKLLAPNTVPYQGMVFSPLAFKPIEENVNLLQNSLKQIEERSEKAATHRAALKKALGEARLKVNQDEESLKFFDQLADNIEAPIRSASERGDLAGAIEATQDAAGEITSNPAYLGLIQNTARYQDAVKSVQERANKGDISNEVKEYWEDTNKFDPNWAYDDNGKIIGSNEWRSNWTPVSQGDIDSMFAGIAKTIAPQKVGPGDGTSEVDPETGVVTHRSGSGMHEWLSEKELKQEFKASLAQNSAYRNMVLQDLRAQVHYADRHADDPDPKVQEKINHIKETYMIGEGAMNDDKYIDDICAEYARRYAYDYNLIHYDEVKSKPSSGSGVDEEGQGIVPGTGQRVNGTVIVLQQPGPYTVNIR